MSDPNEILLFHDSEAEGWKHSILFGSDCSRGWLLECDMEDEKLISAFTPAGHDPLFLMQVEGPVQNHLQYSTIHIQVERDDVEWDPTTRTLTIRDVPL
jgi:hypothetical protein